MKLRIGTRGSELAKRQTELVIDALKKHHPDLEISVKEITTTGDRKNSTLDKGVSDKKEWIYELEQALLNNDIDLAVHSAKDIPASIEEGTAILPVLERATPNDCFIGKLNPQTGQRLTFEELPGGATIGTSSLRRNAALKLLRADITVVEMRGNVPTRIRKLDESKDLSGIVIAAAGIERLALPVQHYLFPLGELLPAMNQGILAVQFRKIDQEVQTRLGDLILEDNAHVFFAERQCAERLRYDCRSAASIYASITAERLFQIEIRDYGKATPCQTLSSGTLQNRNETIDQCIAKIKGCL